MASWFRRFVHASRGARADADLREEMEAHRALRQEQLEREGMTPVEAARASRRALGNVALANDDARDVWMVRWLDALRQDARTGARMLLKHRGVGVTAVLSLALGIGANTAVFSLVDAVLLRPQAYAEPDRLVMISAVPAGKLDQPSSATVPEFLAWQEHATAFEGLATAFQQPLTLGADDNGAPAEIVIVEKVRSTLFEVLGVRPVLGRPLRADEERVDAPAPVVLLADGFWARHYGRDPGVINRVIRLNGVPTTVVGVMPASFSFLSQGRTDLYAPLSFNSPQLRGTGRVFPVVARLKPGMTIRQAQADMDAVVKHVEAQLPPPSRGWVTRIQPLREAMVGGLRLPLLLLQSVVGLVLVIACANVAGLLLARSASRRTEIAVRSAIGAGRGRLVRQLLTESVMLAVIGGAAGLALGWLTLDRLVALSASFLPVLPAVVINARVLAFTFAVSVVTGLVFGALPALGASRPELAESLKSSARGSADAFARTRLRSGLTIAQIALAVMLLVVAGLTLRSLVALEKRDLGGDPDRVLRVTVPFTGLFRQVGSYKGYPLVEASPKVVPTIDGLLDRLQAVPGAASVAGASLPPFTAAGPLIPFEIEGRAPSAATNDQAGLTAAYQVVTRRFFSTMRIPLTAGREFDGRDVSTGPWGIVINAAMARQFWPNESPIGRRVRLDLTPDEQPREIIGVVSNHRNPYEATSQPSMFVLYSQQPPHTRGPSGMVMRNRMSFVIRTAGDPQGVAGAMRSAITDLDRDQPIAEVTSVHEDVMATVAPSRYIAIVLCVFAVVAVLLASVGLYGVMSYKVGQRTREIGVRMALGASRSDVQRLVMGQVLLLTLVGVLGGIAGAAGLLRAMNRLVSGVLVDVTAYDVPTYVGVSAVMIVVALLAGWVPARRALRVAPTIALRSE